VSFTAVQESGCTPLSIACKHEAVKSAEMLLEHNANPNGSANVSTCICTHVHVHVHVYMSMQVLVYSIQSVLCCSACSVLV